MTKFTMYIIAIAALLLFNTPAEAKQYSDEEIEKVVSKHNAKTERKEDRVICKRERATGSHFSKKRCRTRSQIKKDAREARNAIDHLKNIDTTINAGG